MIPGIKQAAVRSALQSAFGVSTFDDISPMTAGLSSALIFRIVVQGKPYLLRIITRTDPMADPTIHFACMKIAAEAGIAPHVWYTSIEDRIAITDFVQATTFTLSEAKIKLPILLRHLHTLPAFPVRLNYMEKVDEFIQKFEASKILPDAMTRDLFRLFRDIKNIYPGDIQQLVSCHNDVKPENILYDGTRAWIVDWEASFLNDRHVDLSIVANFTVNSEEEEREFLRIYYANEPTEYQQACFFLMRQVMHTSYFVFFMLISGIETPIDLNFTKLDFREFHERVWAGDISLASNEVRQQYACIHLERLRHNVNLERFDQSLRIVSAYK